MNNYLLILPIAMLVTYSQLIVKWRAGVVEYSQATSFGASLLRFLTDPVILSAYAAALIASFAWLYVVTRLPLTVAFPAYIGVTFVMVLFGGWFFLAESMSSLKIIAIGMILAGIALGLHADA